MNINGIRPSKIINIYNQSRVKETKNVNIEKSDSVQISNEARSLSNISIDYSTKNSPERIEAVKNQISQGTYKPNSALVAKKMLDIIKGREV